MIKCEICKHKEICKYKDNLPKETEVKAPYVNSETVKRMIYRGEIQAVKVGSRWRISEKEVAKFRGGK